MKRNALLLIRGVVIMAAVMLLITSAELAFDLAGSGLSFSQMIAFNIDDARHFNNALSRNLNQLLAVTFTTVAIAVPLTANMYSLKFLEFFIKDPVNAAVLTLVVFADLNNTWAAYALSNGFIPALTLYLTFALVILCFSLLFPYLYYIFRFLHPNTLLERLGGEINDNLREAARQPRKTTHYRRQAAEGIEHIAN